MNVDEESSENETFENDLSGKPPEADVENMEEMETENVCLGVSGLFLQAEAERLKPDGNKAELEFFEGFDLFNDSDEQVDKVNVNSKVDSTNIEHSKNHGDSGSDSDLKFDLFDTSDDDDELDLVTKPKPGSELDKLIGSGSSSNVTSKPKVNENTEMYSNSRLFKTPPFGVTSGAMGLTNSVDNNNKKDYTGPTPDDDNFCCICMDEHTNPKTLTKCSHSFCTDCIDEHFKIKPTCPVCFVPYGIITGNQPKGVMTDYVSAKTKLPGYEGYGTIVISYSFDDGEQTSEHPNPGQNYCGTSRTGYLPDNAEGRKVLKLLKAAFERRLTFTVGRSRTTGCDNVVTWNDVHHKTCTHGGQQNFGYPDPTYLTRVQEELAALGVTEESLKGNK